MKVRIYTKEAVLVAENLFSSPFEFTVHESKDSATDIVKGLLDHYGTIHNGQLMKFSNNTWLYPDPRVRLSFNHSNIFLDREILVNGETLKLQFWNAIKVVQSELDDVTYSSNAFYDLTIDLYDLDNKKSLSLINEVSVAYKRDSYLVKVKPVSRNVIRPVDQKTNRIDLSEEPSAISSKDIDVNPRYSTLDYDKGTSTRKQRAKADPRFTGLELERKQRRRLEAQTLLFQTDTKQDQTQLQNKTATQKLGKQVATSTQQVSKSIQSQVDKMSYQKAFDTLEDIKRVWDDTDAYNQYTDTVDLSSNWYQNNLVLVSGFDVIDKSYKAADLMRKIAKLREDFYNTKSRSAQSKIQKELDKAQDEFNQLLPEVQKALHGAQGYDQVEKKTQELEERREEYLEDSVKNIAEWKALRDRMEKAGKMIETLEALKSKYISRHDLPPLMPRYKELMETPIPSLIDIDEFEKPEAGVTFTAWRDSMVKYKKALDAFNNAFYTIYDVLAPILGVKARNKSLF